MNAGFLMNCRGRLLDLSSPKAMGILNANHDSFYAPSRVNSDKYLLQAAEKMLQDGAAMLDVGAMSSRPGSVFIPEEEERQRLIPAIDILHRNFPEIILSVDTFRSGILREAVDYGASVLNDISAGDLDPLLIAEAAALGVPYICMHMQGTPANMQLAPHYEKVVQEILDFFISKRNQLRQAGIKDIILDPGFGFGKTREHNFSLLNNLNSFSIVGCPILIGVSRKSMVNLTISTAPADALNGTTVLQTIALMNGARIVRTHDVKEAVEAIKLVEFYTASD